MWERLLGIERKRRMIKKSGRVKGWARGRGWERAGKHNNVRLKLSFLEGRGNGLGVWYMVSCARITHFKISQE